LCLVANHNYVVPTRSSATHAGMVTVKVMVPSTAEDGTASAVPFSRVVECEVKSACLGGCEAMVRELQMMGAIAALGGHPHIVTLLGCVYGTWCGVCACGLWCDVCACGSWGCGCACGPWCGVRFCETWCGACVLVRGVVFVSVVRGVHWRARFVARSLLMSATRVPLTLLRHLLLSNAHHACQHPANIAEAACVQHV
jgi:hypothetical protein